MFGSLYFILIKYQLAVKLAMLELMCVCVCVSLCVCECASVRVYVVYEDTNLYNDMGMTEVLQYEGGLWGHCLCPRNSKGLKKTY